jgi:hypothetical protein
MFPCLEPILQRMPTTMAVTSTQRCEQKTHLRERAIYQDSSNNIIRLLLISRRLLRLRCVAPRESDIPGVRFGDRSHQKGHI